MKRNRCKTKYPGVRYREHPTRMHKRKLDQYFFIRYSLYGQKKEEALGWASEGWTAEKAYTVLGELKAAAKVGQGEATLQEKKEAAKAARIAREKKKEVDRLNSSTIREWGEKMLEHSKENLAPRNYKNEKRICEKFIYPLIGDKAALTLSEIDVQRFRNQVSKMAPGTGQNITLNKTIAPRTVETILLVLSKILKAAGVKDRPTTKIRVPKYDNKSVRYFSREEVNKLLAALLKVSESTHDQAVISLECGLRAGEVFRLRVMNCDFKSGALSIVDSKNKGRNRTVYMTAGVKEILEKRSADKHPHDLIFTPRTGKVQMAVPAIYYKTIKSLKFNEGITDRRFRADFHTLRHTFASWLVMEGVPLYTVQKLLGHESIKTTERYAHLAPDKLKESAAIVDRLRKVEEKVVDVRGGVGQGV